MTVCRPAAQVCMARVLARLIATRAIAAMTAHWVQSCLPLRCALQAVNREASVPVPRRRCSDASAALRAGLGTAPQLDRGASRAAQQ